MASFVNYTKSLRSNTNSTLFQKEDEKTPPDLFYEALITKLDKDVTKNYNYPLRGSKYP